MDASATVLPTDTASTIMLNEETLTNLIEEIIIMLDSGVSHEAIFQELNDTLGENWQEEVCFLKQVVTKHVNNKTFLICSSRIGWPDHLSDRWREPSSVSSDVSSDLRARTSSATGTGYQDQELR